MYHHLFCSPVYQHHKTVYIRKPSHAKENGYYGDSLVRCSHYSVWRRLGCCILLLELPVSLISWVSYYTKKRLRLHCESLGCFFAPQKESFIACHRSVWVVQNALAWSPRKPFPPHFSVSTKRRILRSNPPNENPSPCQ